MTLNLSDRLSAHYRDRTIMVTGASGFIGSHLCDRLQQLGAKIIAVSRNDRRASCSEEAESVNWHSVCYQDEQDVFKLLKAVLPDVIFHLSGMAHAYQELEYVTESLLANVHSTVNLCTAAAKLEIPSVVLPGSMEEPDSAIQHAVPASPFSATKWACDCYARLFANQYNLSIVNCRIFMTYGPGQFNFKKLLPYSILSLLNKKSPKFASGLREIDWVYIDDVITGLLLSACIDKQEAQRVDIGSGQAYTIKWITKKIATLMGSKTKLAFGILPDREAVNTCRADLENTQEYLSWIPQTNIEEGLANTLKWYRENRGLFEKDWEEAYENVG